MPASAQGLQLTPVFAADPTDPLKGDFNNTISENFFANNPVNDLFLSDGQFPGTISTNIIHNNSFTSAVAIFYPGSETIDASQNWFGTNTAAGVRGQIQNPGNERQWVGIKNGVSGTFVLSYNGNPTGPLPINNAATVQSALEGLPGIGLGNVLVSLQGTSLDTYRRVYVIQFRGALANTNVNQLGIDETGLTGGSSPRAAIATLTEGAHAFSVDYTPWLDAGTDVGGNPADGFQGDFSTLNVDDDSPQFGGGGRIIEGLGLTTASSTVVVHAGAYAETPALNGTKTLKLAGAASIDSLDSIAGTTVDLQTSTLTLGNGSVDNTLAGSIQGSTGGLTKQGSDTLTLSGLNTYGGATTVNGGTLKAGVASVANTSGAFGNNSAVTLANTAGVVLDITGFNTQIGSLTGGGATGGNVTLGAATLTVGGDNTSPAAYAGVISGIGGSLTKIGTGTQILSGVNSYTGVTTIGAGTLSVATIGNGGVNSSLGAATSAAGNLVFDGGTLQYTGATASTDRNFTINAGKTATFDVTLAANSLTLAGSSTATNGALTKIGPGTLALSGTNLYTGPTAVNAGTLLVNGSITSNVTVTTPGALGGSGTITGNVSGNGNFSPGNSPGTMTIVGNFTPTGTVNFEVNSPWTAGGTDYDRYLVTGGVTLTGATLTFTNTLDASAPAAFSVLTIINNDGTADLTAPATSPLDGATVTIGTRSFRLFYNGGDGNDVVLVAIGAAAPATVYVDDAWAAYTNGTVIADGDEGTAAAEPAVFGVNAFATPSAGVAAAAASGTIIVNDGVYTTDAVNLVASSNKTLQLTRKTLGAASSTVTIGSIDSTAGSTVALGTNTLILSNGDASAANTLAGTLTGGGVGSGLTKQGTDTLTINVANTFTAPTTIDGGVLSISNGGALGTATVTINSTGTFEIDGVIHTSAINLNNGGTLRGVGTAAENGAIAVDSTVANPGASVTIATAAAGNMFTIGHPTTPFTNNGTTFTPTVNVAGAGTVIETAGNAAFRGKWNLQGGTLQVSNASAFGVATMSGTLTGSTVTLAGGNLRIRSDAALTFTNIPVIVSANGTVTFQRATPGIGVIHTLGTLSIGTQELTLTNDAVTVTSGNANLTFANLATVSGNPIFHLTRTLATTEPVFVFAGGLSDGGVGGAARVITFDSNGSVAGEVLAYVSSAARTLDNGTRIDLTGSQIMRYVVDGVSATDTSTIRFNNSLAFFEPRNNGPASFGNGLLLDSNGEVRVARVTSGAGVTHTLTGTLTVNGNRTLVLNATNLTANSAYGLIISGLVSFTGSGTTNFTTNNFGTGLGTLTISNVIAESDAGISGLTKAGAGTLVLSNAANTYSGVTTVSAGALSVPTLAAGGSASSIGDSSNAAANLVIAGGTLRYTGAMASTDRLFTVGTGTTNIIEASGTGPLSFTSTGAIALSGTNATRTLTLSGTNTGANTLRPTLGNNGSGVTSLIKTSPVPSGTDAEPVGNLRQQRIYRRRDDHRGQADNHQ